MSNVYYNLTDIPFKFQVAEPDGYDCFGHNHFHIIILVSSSLLRKTPRLDPSQTSKGNMCWADNLSLTAV